MLVIPWKQKINYGGYAIPWAQRSLSYCPAAKRWDDIPDAGLDVMGEINAIEPDSYYKIEKIKKILKKHNGKKGRTSIGSIDYRFIVVDGNRCWISSRKSNNPDKNDINYGLWKPEKLNLVMSGQYGHKVDVPPRLEMTEVEGTWLYIPRWYVSASYPDGSDFVTRYQFRPAGISPGKIVNNVSFIAYFITRSEYTRHLTVNRFNLEFTLNKANGCYDVEGEKEWIWHRKPEYIGKKFDIGVLGGATLNDLEDLGPFKTCSVEELYEKRNYFLHSVPYGFD